MKCISKFGSLFLLAASRTHNAFLWPFPNHVACSVVCMRLGHAVELCKTDEPIEMPCIAGGGLQIPPSLEGALEGSWLPVVK